MMLPLPAIRAAGKLRGPHSGKYTALRMTIDPANGPLAHLLFETLAYVAGFRLYLRERKLTRSAALRAHDALWICAGAIVGAALGSKIVFWAQYPDFIYAHRTDPAVLLGGKTIVGGLLGGLLGVEITKSIRDVRQSTGDSFVLPLIAGIALGRLGCFFAGVDDNTYGNPTTLPWGVLYPDGIARHPVALYEILFLVMLWILITRVQARLARPGDAFKLFIASYLAFRFAIDFIKPPHYPSRTPLEEAIPAGHLYFHALTGIQLFCAAGLAYHARDLWRMSRERLWQK